MSDCPKVSNAIKPRLEHGWEPRISSSHPERVYYWNRFTGNSVWEMPETKPSSSSISTLSSSPSSLSSKSSISKLSEAGSSKKPTSKTKSPELFGPKSCPKITQKGVEEKLKTIKRPIKTHNIAASQTSKPFKTSSQTKESKFDLKQKLTLFLNGNDISPEKTIKTGKSPLLRRVIVPPSATISVAPFSPQKSYDFKDPIDCLSDMEVETMTSDNEENLQDVEMEDISKELMSDLISNKEEQVSNAFHIVIDTNILLHNFDLVKILKDIYIRDCGKPVLVIPSIVIYELDDIKKKSTKESIRLAARKANRLIYTMLKSKHPQIHVDTVDKEDFLATQPSLNWDVADDKILFSGLKLKKKIGHKNVCLLTNDKNLMNKSMVSGLKCQEPEEILEFLKTNYKRDIVVPKNPQLTNADKMDNTMKSAFKTLTNCLSPFLLEKMKEKYRDSWETVIYRKPPWVSLLDILENYSKHWISVFSHLLPVPCKTNLEKMKDIYQESKGYIYQTQESCRFLDASIYFLTECDKQFNIFQVPINRLKEIKQEVCDICAFGDGTDIQSEAKNFQSPFSPLKSRFENSGIISESDANVLNNLHYLWLRVFTHYTCLMLDSLNFDHKIPYNKPANLPSKNEAFDFIPKLFKFMQDIRTALRKFLYPRKDTTDEEIKGYLKTLHKQFSIIPSSLKIDIYLPFAHMDFEDLEGFLLNSDYRQVLNDAYNHFNNLFAKLNQAISTVSYDELIEFS